MLALLNHGRGNGNSIEGKKLADRGNEVLLLQKHRYLVNGWHISNDYNLLGVNQAEVSNLLNSTALEVDFASAGDLDAVSFPSFGVAAPHE
jgi:hypothetical protein